LDNAAPNTQPAFTFKRRLKDFEMVMQLRAQFQALNSIENSTGLWQAQTDFNQLSGCRTEKALNLHHALSDP
jgi:hypothetical protein